MPLEVLRRAKETLRCDFAQAYGMTEASPVLTILAAEDHVLDSRSDQAPAGAVRFRGGRGGARGRPHGSRTAAAAKRARSSRAAT